MKMGSPVYVYLVLQCLYMFALVVRCRIREIAVGSLTDFHGTCWCPPTVYIDLYMSTSEMSLILKNLSPIWPYYALKDLIEMASEPNVIFYLEVLYCQLCYHVLDWLSLCQICPILWHIFICRLFLLLSFLVFRCLLVYHNGFHTCALEIVQCVNFNTWFWITLNG
jgi:hypothetical protein